MSKFSERVVLVTGAARERGIGRGIATVLARAGYAIAVNDIADTADEADTTVSALQQLGVPARAYLADVSDRDQVDGMINDIEADLGPLYGVVSNAGIAGWSGFEDLTRDQLDKIVAVNLTGTFNVTQAAARVMVPRGQGRIVVTSSVHVQMPMTNMAVYGATKQAIRALVDHMAVELAPFGVLANHIGPGWVKSFLNDNSPSLQTTSDEEATLALIPVGRPADPEEMGHAVEYLLSEGARYVAGAFIRVDGGFVVGKY